MDYKINGNTIYAGTGGKNYQAAAETIVFVHGAGMDHSIWILFSRFFARNNYNTFAVDLPGHGLSSGTALPSIEQMADWLERFLDAAAIANVTLVGHSMGSLIAIETAARLAQRIRRIILLGVACPMPVGEPLLAAARENRHAAIDMIMLYGHAYCSQLGGNPVAGVHIVNNNMRLLERSLDGRLYADLNACNAYVNGLQAARKIVNPVTLILGEADRMTPPDATQPLMEALSCVEVEILHNCGHMLPAEQPEQVHGAMVRAMGRQQSGSCEKRSLP